MSNYFEHGDTIDMRDLVEKAREYADILEGDDAADASEDDRDDARAALTALEEVASDLGLGVAGNTYAALVDAIEQYAEDEPTAISADYFEQYAEELAEDLGMIQRDAPWPARHIDWEAAAEELKTDYSTFTLEGNDYLIRAV